MLPFHLIAMFVAGISAYRYTKDARPSVAAKAIIVSTVTTSILVYWLTGRWGLSLSVIQLCVTLFVTVHLQLLSVDGSGETQLRGDARH
ncbi:MAG TPA: hypothetical protein DDW52_01480 [Planctomycetaceae bacterium]|nr:hypothetical protein [Planctomycetaceae bacterium]